MSNVLNLALQRATKHDNPILRLDELPEWAQRIICDTALNLLNDSEAVAIKDIFIAGEQYHIYAHEFRYTVNDRINHVF